MEHMKFELVKQSIKHIESLAKEKAALEKRLAQINEVLMQFDELLHFLREKLDAEPKPRKGPKVKKSPSTKRVRNKLSLRKAVFQATEKEPLTKAEIMEAVVKLGYQFSSDKPMNSLNSVLYGKDQFKRENGRFSPALKKDS